MGCLLTVSRWDPAVWPQLEGSRVRGCLLGHLHVTSLGAIAFLMACWLASKGGSPWEGWTDAVFLFIDDWPQGGACQHLFPPILRLQKSAQVQGEEAWSPVLNRGLFPVTLWEERVGWGADRCWNFGKGHSLHQPPRNLPPLFPGLSVFTLCPWALLLPGGRVNPTHFRGAASASSATFRPSCKIWLTAFVWCPQLPCSLSWGGFLHFCGVLWGRDYMCMCWVRI